MIRGIWYLRNAIATKAAAQWNGAGASVAVSAVEVGGKRRWVATVAGVDAVEEIVVADSQGRRKLYGSVQAALADVMGVFGEFGISVAVAVDVATAYHKAISVDVVAAAAKAATRIADFLLKNQETAVILDQSIQAAAAYQTGNAAQQAVYAELMQRVAAVQGEHEAAQAMLLRYQVAPK